MTELMDSENGKERLICEGFRALKEQAVGGLSERGCSLAVLRLSRLENDSVFNSNGYLS